MEQQTSLNLEMNEPIQESVLTSTTTKRKRNISNKAKSVKKDPIIKAIRNNSSRRSGKKADDQVSSIDFTTKIYADKVELVLNKDCEIVNEDGKMFVVRKYKEFPLSIQASLKILNAKHSYCVCGYNDKIMKAFYKLLVLRDAYIKVAEDKAPIWKSGEDVKYCIKRGKLTTSVSEPCILAFHSEEVRNLFYENFKGLINECKELLG